MLTPLAANTPEKMRVKNACPTDPIVVGYAGHGSQVIGPGDTAQITQQTGAPMVVGRPGTADSFSTLNGAAGMLRTPLVLTTVRAGTWHNADSGMTVTVTGDDADIETGVGIEVTQGPKRLVAVQPDGGMAVLLCAASLAALLALILVFAHYTSRKPTKLVKGISRNTERPATIGRPATTGIPTTGLVLPSAAPARQLVVVS